MPFKDLKVLIVDDSRTSIILIKQQLNALGFSQDNLYSALTCVDAIKSIEVHSFDVLIIDYHLEQALTGFELVTILYRNRMIRDKIGILIISGDARQETVLTSLSGKVRHFISKPIQTKALGEKVDLVVNESYSIEELHALYPVNSSRTLSEALSIVNSSDSKISLESALIEHLIDSKNYPHLCEVVTHSSTSIHPTKIVAQALLLEQSGQVQVAIDSLHLYLIDNPLSLKVIDCLSYMYELNGKIEEALSWAVKAFELTPSISSRAIKAVQLAEKIRNRDVIIKVGYTYACHISLADINWFQSIASYLLILKSTYQHSDQGATRRTILSHLSNFIMLVGRRLKGKRHSKIQALLLLFQSHVLIFEGEDQQAHQKMMACIALFYDDFNECPPTILNQLLPLLANFGESAIYHAIDAILENKGRRTSQLDTQNLPISSTFIDFEQLDSLKQVETHMAQYPHSIGAKLCYLYTMPDAMRKTRRINTYISQLIQLELPPNWNRWITDSLEKGFSTKPPTPFSITT